MNNLEGNTCHPKKIDIMEALKNLENLSPSKSGIILNYDEPSKDSIKSNHKYNEGEIICNLIEMHIKYFYYHIHIPLEHFEKSSWQISKILFRNKDSLYHNPTYMSKDDDEKFSKVFARYIDMINSIMTPNCNLYNNLISWTDHLSYKKIATDSPLQKLLYNMKYNYISPRYIVDTYYKNINKTNGLEITIFKLNNIRRKLEIEIHAFEKKYVEIVDAYTYDRPLNEYNDTITKGFINSIILEIIDFADKLIDIRIYAIHSIIDNIIDYYTPLDYILRVQDNEKQLYIV